MDLRAVPGMQVGVIRPKAASGWGLEALAGRLTELSSTQGGTLSLAMGLVLESQLIGETAAWITAGQGLFYPPDAAVCGVALDALPVVRTQDARQASRAAEHLARSGAFGLIVLDLGDTEPPSMALQARLAKLAQRHETALLCLTRKSAEENSVSPLISLRAQVRFERTETQDWFVCQLRALKDKRRAPGWTSESLRRHPLGETG